MSESDGPKFACASCGREFRWKPELAGKKAKCKCGAVVAVPAQEPLALEPPPAEPVPIHVESEDPFAAFDQGGYGAGDDPSAAGPPPPPPANACPVCGTPALPTAVMCMSCGYNFRTGLKTVGFGRPVAPREPDAGGTIAADTYQLAAKVSWMAPVAGILLGCCIIGAAVKGSPILTGVLAILQLVLILAGIGLGVFALTGIRRNGAEGILVPSIVGMSLSGVIVLLGIIGAVMQSSGRDPFGARGRAANAGAAATRIRTAADAERAGEESFAEAGWLGVASYKGATITLVSVSDTSPLAAEVLANLRTPVSILVLGIDNSGARGTFPVDPAGGRVHLKDGTSQPLPDMIEVLRTMTRDREEALGTFAPPFHVPPRGQVVGKVVFIPPKTDPQHIDAVSLTVDGKTINVQGKFLSAEDKANLMRAGAAGKK